MSELEIIRHTKVGGISIFFDTVEYRTPHFHPEWELIWITDGALAVSCGQQKAVCGEGELCLFPPKQVHEFRRQGSGSTFLCLQIAPQVFSFSCPGLAYLTADDFRLGPQLSPDDRSAMQRSMLMLLKEYLSGGELFELRCVERCAQILGTALGALPTHRLSEEEISSADKRNQRLSRFIRYVDENYAGRLSLEDFARREGCSVSYMSRFLRSSMNQSFQDYVNTVRFHAACRLIAAGERRMLDVCVASGFSDYRYFSACFKKHCGLTPEEYRRQMPPADAFPVQRSLHSRERFYTRAESQELMERLLGLGKEVNTDTL